jgi:hypothetical protein
LFVRICPSRSCSTYTTTLPFIFGFGTYASSSGQSICSACAAGTFAPYTQTIECQSATPGYYVDTTGASDKKQCASGHYSSIGAAACSYCSQTVIGNPGVKCCPGSQIGGTLSSLLSAAVSLKTAMTSYQCNAVQLPKNNPCETSNLSLYLSAVTTGWNIGKTIEQTTCAA